MQLYNKTTIKVIGFNTNTLSLYKLFLTKILKKLNLSYSLIKKIVHNKKITLLKSPHVHKKAREQFQLSKHSFIINTFVPRNLNVMYFLKLNKPNTIKTQIIVQTPVIFNKRDTAI